MKLGFFDLLGLIFITLKLAGVIAWSWGWVLLPLAPWGLVVVMAIAVMLKASA